MLADNRIGIIESDIDGLSINNTSEVALGLLGERERLVLDCAVKEYLMGAGYKISAMTFQEEVLYTISGILRVCGCCKYKLFSIIVIVIH